MQSSEELESVSLWSPWQQVNSNNLGAIRYNGFLKKLQVAFLNGRKYEYDEFEPTSWDSLRAAPSPGKFFYHAIRTFEYVYREI